MASLCILFTFESWSLFASIVWKMSTNLFPLKHRFCKLKIHTMAISEVPYDITIVVIWYLRYYHSTIVLL